MGVLVKRGYGWGRGHTPASEKKRGGEGGRASVFGVGVRCWVLGVGSGLEYLTGVTSRRFRNLSPLFL